MFLKWRDHRDGFDAGQERETSSPRRKKRAPNDLLGATGFWYKKLVLGLLGRLNHCNRTDLLLAVPPLAMLGFLGFVFFQVYAHADDIEYRYRQGAQAAMDANDIPRAKTFFSRIVNEQELSNQDRLNWAMILSNTGESARAQQILDELAPEDRLGYVPAHRVKALGLANLLGPKQDAETLRSLRAQLEFASDNSPQINHAWAKYYLAVEQSDTALGYLGAAARTDPQFLIMIANINELNGRQPARDRALRQAEEEYRRLLVQDPLDTRIRVTLARVIARLEKYGEAEQTLLTGLRLNSDSYLQQATADYYVMRYDLAARAGKPFGELFKFLQQALIHDGSQLSIYERLIQLYQRQGDNAEAKTIKDTLLRAVASDQPSAMAHFAMSNLYWGEGNFKNAQWHVEQAYDLDPKSAFVINNLAWMLAHQENPDLERAVSLAETVLDTAPNDSRFLDTYGSILLLQEKYDQAIKSLQKALPTDNQEVSRSVHKKLAACYQAIGQTELAKMHSEQAAPPPDENKQR